MNELISKLKAYGVEMDTALERFMGDEDLYEICFKAFLADKAFNGLNGAVENENYKDAFDCAHTLKGVAGNLGLTDMFKATTNVLEALKKEEFSTLKSKVDKVFEDKMALEGLIGTK